MSRYFIVHLCLMFIIFPALNCKSFVVRLAQLSKCCRSHGMFHCFLVDGPCCNDGS